MADVDWKAARNLLICGSLVVSLALGTRHAFGLFLQPVSLAHGWGRETFALAMALQNLVWGVAQPFAGLLADRHGAGRVIAGGAVLYIAGLALMAAPLGAVAFVLAAGVLVGLGLSGTTFPIVFGALGRALPPERRSLAFGVAMAFGSFGQFVMLPASLALLDGVGWQRALLVLSALSALMLPLALALRERGRPAVMAVASAGAAFKSAVAHRDFLLLSLGFFVCGFQIVLIAIHLPAFLADRGLPLSVASTVLALIGLVNIAGTLGAGYLGGRRSKPGLLAWLYLARGLVIAAFAFLPVSATSAWLFGIAMGLLWLSTVPLTNGIVVTMFGVHNLSMLGGVVFLAHQVGSFLGGWLGGVIYDRLGSYD
jgi:MFS family permease